VRARRSADFGLILLTYTAFDFGRSRSAVAQDYHPPVATKIKPERLYYTGIDEADRLLAEDPLALLIGFVLDQQVTLQKAFAGPYDLRKRIGTLDAAEIAAMDAGTLEAAFKERPALHRFPGNMARRTQALCAQIVEDYGGDAGAVWRDVTDGKELERRLLGLPGIGEMKARTIIGILGKQFGVQPNGWEALAPQHPSLADADSLEAVAEYQAGKRAHKAQMRSEGRKS
jgi:uncharacterized HhH-GPD family protein